MWDEDTHFSNVKRRSNDILDANKIHRRIQTDRGDAACTTLRLLILFEMESAQCHPRGRSKCHATRTSLVALREPSGFYGSRSTPNSPDPRMHSSKGRVIERLKVGEFGDTA